VVVRAGCIGWNFYQVHKEKSLRAIDLFNGWPVGDEIVKRRYVRRVSVLLRIKVTRFIFVFLVIGVKGWGSVVRNAQNLT